MVDWISLAVPFAYLGVLIGSLATFSSLYRKRKAQKSTSLEPWFPAHLQRDIYFSLLHLDPPASNDNKNKEKKTPPVPDSVLKAALLKRAVEDINRVMALRVQKPALGMLLQRGSVGDDLWQRFSRAEKEMEDEVRDVVAEANAYTPNWGQTIFQSANEMMNNEVLRQKIGSHQAKISEEREWWGRKKASIQEGFMKELDADADASANANAQSSTTTKTAPGSVPAPADVPATSASTSNTPESPTVPSTTGSDDDAVLVEADGQSGSAGTPTTTGGSVGGGGGKKKKKGKK